MVKLQRRLSKKEIKRLREQNKLRDAFEIWLDFHNHKLELIRTIASFLAFLSSLVVLLKLFKFI